MSFIVGEGFSNGRFSRVHHQETHNILFHFRIPEFAKGKVDSVSRGGVADPSPTCKISRSHVLAHMFNNQNE